jgi:hypothetical protein
MAATSVFPLLFPWKLRRFNKRVWLSVTYNSVLFINSQFFWKTFQTPLNFLLQVYKYLPLKIRTTSSVGQIRTNITIKLCPSLQYWYSELWDFRIRVIHAIAVSQGRPSVETFQWVACKCNGAWMIIARSRPGRLQRAPSLPTCTHRARGALSVRFRQQTHPRWLPWSLYQRITYLHRVGCTALCTFEQSSTRSPF